jgi:hypothetical protein
MTHAYTIIYRPTGEIVGYADTNRSAVQVAMIHANQRGRKEADYNVICNV